MAMMELKYNNLKHSLPFVIRIPFSESEIYFNQKLKPLIINTILNFEVNYIRLSHKYELGMPFHSMEYLANPYMYEKKYLENAYEYLQKRNEISFYVKSLKENEGIYRPLISKMYYYGDGGIIINRYTIDIDDLKIPENYKQATIISQPPFDMFGEGYSENTIEESQEVNEMNYIMLHFGIESNIFYPYLENFETGKIVNNRAIAYRNAPRYNSFLREIKILCKKYGFEIGLSEKGVLYQRMPYETENGILLDGKIIYQEDIDEGRIKIPADAESD